MPPVLLLAAMCAVSYRLYPESWHHLTRNTQVIFAVCFLTFAILMIILLARRRLGSYQQKDSHADPFLLQHPTPATSCLPTRQCLTPSCVCCRRLRCHLSLLLRDLPHRDPGTHSLLQKPEPAAVVRRQPRCRVRPQKKGHPEGRPFHIQKSYFLAVANRLLISSQFTVFHQAAR
jgi:hypothetical protein